MKYTCYIRESYLFAEIDGLGIALIDSGAVGSISDREMATIAGKEVRFAKSVLGQIIKGISQILDTEIDALIGADILKVMNLRHGGSFASEEISNTALQTAQAL